MNLDGYPTRRSRILIFDKIILLPDPRASLETITETDRTYIKDLWFKKKFNDLNKTLEIITPKGQVKSRVCVYLKHEVSKYKKFPISIPEYGITNFKVYYKSNLPCPVGKYIPRIGKNDTWYLIRLFKEVVNNKISYNPGPFYYSDSDSFLSYISLYLWMKKENYLES